MYVRQIDGQEATFGVSGTLWRDAVVFFDRQTDSYWSQITGTAIRGQHEGKRLAEIPSTLTTWGEWKARHPDTWVLRPSEESRQGSPYEKYFEDPERLGVLGRANPDDRLPGKTRVLGIRAGSATGAVTMDRLAGESVVQGVIGAVPVVAVSASSLAGFAYDRRVDDQALDFKPAGDGRMSDAATGSVWDIATGRALDGPMKGRALQRLDSLRVYWFVWASFHAGTTILDRADP